MDQGIPWLTEPPPPVLREQAHGETGDQQRDRMAKVPWSFTCEPPDPDHVPENMTVDRKTGVMRPKKKAGRPRKKKETWDG
jgi:hypothetical protein